MMNTNVKKPITAKVSFRAWIDEDDLNEVGRDVDHHMEYMIDLNDEFSDLIIHDADLEVISRLDDTDIEVEISFMTEVSDQERFEELEKDLPCLVDTDYSLFKEVYDHKMVVVK